MKALRWCSFVIVVWAGLCASGTTFAGAVNSAFPSEVPAAEYERAHTLVDVANGRRLNLFCMGKGLPVVMLEAGGGDDSLTFRRVQGRIAAMTRVCSYDRAGVGFSDPSDGPSTAVHAIHDLHALVRKASIPIPFILVGHSDGGFYATLYAASYPADIAGMVLIDPMTFGQNVSATSVLDRTQLHKWTASDASDVALARKCFALSENGALAQAPMRHRDCLDYPPNPSASLHKLLNAQLARPSEQEALLSETLDTYPPNDGGLSPAEKVMQGIHFDFADKPVIVMTATNEQSNLPPIQRKKVRQVLLATADALAARSTNGMHIQVKCTGEYIQTHRPDSVVSAVKTVVNAARAKAAGRGVVATPNPE